MGSGFKKIVIDMGSYTSSTKEQEAYMWCIRNNIYIAPKPATTTDWYLDININGRISTSPSSYKKNDIWKQLYSFYVYYYDKYANKVEVKTVKDPEIKSKKPIKKEDNNNLKLF